MMEVTEEGEELMEEYRPHRIYLAGPTYHTEDHGREWRDLLLEEWGEHERIEWVDPTAELIYDADEGNADEVVKNDKSMIRECDAILVGYTGDPSPGTWREVEYALSVVEIPVFIWTGPASTEAVVKENPFSPWAKEAGVIGAWLDHVIFHMVEYLDEVVDEDWSHD